MERAQKDSPERPWTTRVIAIGAAALAAIALIVVVGALVHRSGPRPLVMTAGSTSSTSSAGAGPTSAGPTGAAGAEAAEVQQLVNSVKRPPGATALTGCPAAASGPVRALPQATAATGSRCWSVPTPQSRTIAWERHHHPAHLQAAGTVHTSASGAGKAPAATGLLFQDGRQGGLELSVYPSGGGSVLRVDGYVSAEAAAMTSVG